MEMCQGIGHCLDISKANVPFALLNLTDIGAIKLTLKGEVFLR